MSRLKKFTRSLFSGYVQLGANIFYTLAGVPLALHYLSKAEFGLWALVSQLGGYILLLDLGMSGSIFRILIDYKDHRSSGAYGSVIKTGWLVGIVQGVLIIAAGVALSFFAGALLHVETDLRREFIWLMAGQSVLLGASFTCRIFGNLLMAHQRPDITNLGASVFFFINLAVMWAGFANGLGIYSFLLGQAVMVLGNNGVGFWGCRRLKLLPNKGEWGVVNRAHFKELFAFGRDFFLVVVGGQLINASQTILLTRLLGLEAAAVWSICTRAYTVLFQILTQISNYATPALGEIMVRGEKALLTRRFQQLVGLTFAASIAAACVFALCNSAFVTVWTRGRIAWPHVNDLLLAIWLVFSASMRLHIGFAGMTKKFHFMRYLLFVEGAVFIGLTLLLYRHGGITMMLAISIVCTGCLSLRYGLYRTCGYFGLSLRKLLAWHRSGIIVLCWMLPVAAVVWRLTMTFPPLTQLIWFAGVLVPWGTFVLFRFGLDSTLQNEIIGKLPDSVRPAVRRLTN